MHSNDKHQSFIALHEKSLEEIEQTYTDIATGMKRKDESLTEHPFEVMIKTALHHPHTAHMMEQKIYEYLYILMDVCKTLMLKGELVELCHAYEEKIKHAKLAQKESVRTDDSSYNNDNVDEQHHFQKKAILPFYLTNNAESKKNKFVQQETIARTGNTRQLLHQLINSEPSRMIPHTLSVVNEELNEKLCVAMAKIEKFTALLLPSSPLHQEGAELAEKLKQYQEQWNEKLSHYYALYGERNFEILKQYMEQALHQFIHFHGEFEGHHVEMARVEMLHALFHQLEYSREKIREKNREEKRAKESTLIEHKEIENNIQDEKNRRLENTWLTNIPAIRL